MHDPLADASPIRTPEDLGEAVRRHRRSRGLTQQATAALGNVSVPFLSNFENGKPTAQIGKILQTLEAMGLELFVVPRARVHARRERTP